jgi:hypothetical protein
MKNYTVEIEFTEPILGTVPKDKEIFKTYVQSKGEKNGDEEETHQEDAEIQGWTGFHMIDGSPILYDYMVKGFFKDACSMLRRDGSTASSRLTAFKKCIDGMMFVYPRQIPIELSGEMGVLERPIRASTPKGDRVALTRSDTCPAGSKLSITIKAMGPVTKKLIKEWLDYGEMRGLGQWRNASYGRFTFELVE